MTATEHVILVDEFDNPIGIAEKLQAHRDNLCHRAFSVFVFRQQPQLEILLQQRAKQKYHSALRWTNTCCSHPRPGEDIIFAGQRRLKEEMGFSVPLRSVGSFHYIAHFNNGLTENEVDHVLVGEFGGEEIVPAKDEVEDFRWVSVAELRKELLEGPERFTPWLAEALGLVEKVMGLG